MTNHEMNRTVFLLITATALLWLGTPRVLAQATVHPLEPLDRSSPRATLTSFLAITDEIGQAVIQYLQTQNAASIHTIRGFVAKAMRSLDLSEIAPTARIEVGQDATTLLWEILARIELPPMASVPDLATMEDRIRDGKPAHWTIPHTEIQIALVKEGPQAGEYLFSSETVSRLEEFYQRTRALPYRRPMAVQNPRQVQLVGGGPLMPFAIPNALPDWLKIVVFEQVLWKWIATSCCWP
jgi:MscS family membrane protein